MSNPTRELEDAIRDGALTDRQRLALSRLVTQFGALAAKGDMPTQHQAASWAVLQEPWQDVLDAMHPGDTSVETRLQELQEQVKAHDRHLRRIDQQVQQLRIEGGQS